MSTQSFDTLITNGLVVTRQGITRADTGIRGEKIVAMDTPDASHPTPHPSHH